VNRRPGLGIFREKSHSPGRESDDSEILRLTAQRLQAHGFAVELRDPEDAEDRGETPPAFVFMMCERIPILTRLAEWEEAGVPHVNSTRAVRNTYRDLMIAQFKEANVPFIASRIVESGERPAADLPVWVKRADVHNTQEGDVVFATTPEVLASALGSLRDRGIPRAVLQPHVSGDLVKFYGIGSDGRGGEPGWFRCFYHQHQVIHHYPFDERRLARLARAAAVALGLEIYGGDAIATPDGDLVLLDLNAWPSFAKFREEASARIAEHLALRFRRALR
jgi:hypothetical protein